MELLGRGPGPVRVRQGARRLHRLALLALLAWAGAAAPARADSTLLLTGHIASAQPDWVYVPFDVPAGTNRIDVSYSYNRVEGNALDIGLFDQKNFRGWSGGARTAYFVTASDATPGYDAGPLEPGRWRVILGPYTVGPSGIDYSITVTLHSGAQGKAFKPAPPPQRVKGKGPGWYRGDLHLHTVYSDGGYTPQDIVAGARAAGLDFFVSTEHNTDSADRVWGRFASKSLLTIGGEEVTTRGGHWGAIGLAPGTWIDWRYRPSDNRLAQAVKRVHKAGGLAIANHPFAPCKACNWSFPYGPMDAIEVWNGVWTPDDELALQAWDTQLRAGRHVAAVGGSDAHRAPDKIGLPQNVVHASALSRPAIIKALAAGRSYIVENKGVSLEFSVKRARVKLKVHGAPAGSKATLFTDHGAITGTTVKNARWVRAEIRKPDMTMLALTNPIWLK